MGKWGHREGKRLPQGHTASKHCNVTHGLAVCGPQVVHRLQERSNKQASKYQVEKRIWKKNKGALSESRAKGQL